MKYIMILLLLTTQMSIAKNTEPELELELKKNNEPTKKINNPKSVTVFCSCDITDEHGQFLSTSISTGEGKDQEEAKKKAIAHCKKVVGSHTQAYNCSNATTKVPIESKESPR